MIIYLITACISATLLMLILYLKDHGGKKCIPGISIWNVLFLKVDSKKFHLQLTELGRKYDCLHKFASLTIVKDNLLAQEVLSKQDPIFANRLEDLYYPGHILSNESVSTLNRNFDEVTKLMRKEIFKGIQMHGKGLDQFESTVRDELIELLDYLDDSRGKSIYPKQLIESSIVNIMTTVLFGEKFDYSSEEVKVIAEMDRAIALVGDFAKCPEVFANPFTPLLLKLPLKRYRDLNNNLENAVLIRDKLFSEVLGKYQIRLEAKTNSCLVSSLLAAQESYGKDVFTDVMVQGVILDVIFAGLITTSSVVLGFIYTMACRPEVQKKVYDELNRVTGDERLARTTDKPDTPYTCAVLLEQLRFQSVTPLGVPRVSSKQTTLMGYTIPQRSVLMINQWAINHDAVNWKDPDEFHPENFLLKDGSLLSIDEQKTKGFQPFGAGRRACIGEVLAKSRFYLMATALVQRFQILPPEGKTFPQLKSSDLEFSGIVMPAPFEVRFLRRD